MGQPICILSKTVQGKCNEFMALCSAEWSEIMAAFIQHDELMFFLSFQQCTMMTHFDTTRERASSTVSDLASPMVRQYTISNVDHVFIGNA